MTQELLLQSITAIYAVCNAARLLSYVPQIVAVAREMLRRSCALADLVDILVVQPCGYRDLLGATVVNDALLAGMDVGKCHWVRRHCFADDDKTAAVRLEADGTTQPPAPTP